MRKDGQILPCNSKSFASRNRKVRDATLGQRVQGLRLRDKGLGCPAKVVTGACAALGMWLKVLGLGRLG